MLPIVGVVRPAAFKGTLSQANGKGLTIETALLTGLMEAYERYCAEPHGREYGPHSFDEMTAMGLNAVRPDSLILATGAKWSERQPLYWVRASRLGQPRLADYWIPSRAVFVPDLDAPSGPPLFRATSHGLASANDSTQATLRALLEVVERDAATFGEYFRDGKMITLDRSSLLKDPQGEELIRLVDHCEQNGLRVSLHSFDSLVYETAYAVLWDPESPDPMLVNSGTSCRPGLIGALISALLEAAQSRAGVISGAREDLAREMSRRSDGFGWEHIERLNQWLDGWETRLLTASSGEGKGSNEDVLRECIHVLRKRGFDEIYVVDLSVDPDLHTHRIVVPGLEVAVDDESRVGSRFAARYVRYKMGRNE